jgi:hypothetical protein
LFGKVLKSEKNKTRLSWKIYLAMYLTVPGIWITWKVQPGPGGDRARSFEGTLLK